jgi:tRNA threonylcarbamoyladenosine biosynthesis protein TsaB
MLLLSADTATTSCSVAVSQDDTILVELTKNIHQTHSRQLMELIDFALHSAQKSLAEVDGYVLTRGPGSFTGLRIGISTIKGLALVTGKPIVSVSCLEILAHQVPLYPHVICPMLDARRSEVYTSQYRWQAKALTPHREEAVMPPSEAIKGLRGPCLFIGNGARLYQDLIVDTLKDKAQIAQPWQHIIRGATIARIGFGKMLQHRFEDVSCLSPKYLRKSDAEIHLEQST